MVSSVPADTVPDSATDNTAAVIRAFFITLLFSLVLTLHAQALSALQMRRPIQF
ncbi:hypothetical protein ADIMK_1379 [Marinobacterium lacunae]|uniref:Uncharacterized protein n=1 Tax=Marinobacterium lacunae TaxID=1232683 RepID=A0A081G028_9GAMM|nr:hypothetical protein ADIMK_1379 [Marinobacterium lacunae]